MTENSVKDVFTFTWRIENFSMCPHGSKQSIMSPAFVVDVLKETKFLVCLYPKGFQVYGPDSVTCVLYWRNRKEDPEEITMNFRLSMIKADMNLVQLWSKQNQVLQKADSVYFGEVCPRSTLFADKKKFLPNDVLTLQLCISPATDQEEFPKEPNESTKVQDPTFSLEEVSSVVSDDSMIEHCRTNSCLTTRIPVERRQVTWTIRNFDSMLKTKKRIHVSVESKLRWKSALLLSCYASEDGGTVRIDIQRKDRDFTQIFVRCKVFVLDGNNIARAFKEGEHLFGEHYEIWSFPPIIKLLVLKKSRDVFLPDDSLSLRCEFLVSYKGEEDVFIVSDRKTRNFVKSDVLRSELVTFLKRRQFTDVCLISEGFEIAAHKVVICAQSPVFREMFSGDTEENRTGLVIITDIDAETVTNMRNFMYNDGVPELKPEDAIKLYSAADKFQISKLKKLCAIILKYNLTLDNVCNILVLADRHQDSDLMRSVVNFLRIHENDVLQSNQWNELMNHDIPLAEGIMCKIKTFH